MNADISNSTLPISVPKCKLCHHTPCYMGSVDFNKSGNDYFVGERMFPKSDKEVTYFRCDHCGLMFTDYFYGWSDEEFGECVYNDEYLKADPPFEEERPQRMARFLQRVLSNVTSPVTHLDYGGGRGRLGEELEKLGFRSTTTFDPHHPECNISPTKRFDLVTAFEVVEHVADQLTLFENFSRFMKPNGLLLVTTMLQPDDILQQGANWWYACPRNAHMTFHTASSLEITLSTIGLKLVSLTQEIHLGYTSESQMKSLFTTTKDLPPVNV